jgi:hypothetical protein
MSTPIRVKTNEVTSRMIEAYFEEGISRAELADRFGRSISAINKHIKQHQIIYKAENGHERGRKASPVDPRLQLEKKSISFLHFSIGLHISRYLAEHKMRLSAFGMSMHPPRSRVVVSNMLSGSHDFTLKEVMGISKVVGVPFTTLLTPQTDAANTNMPERSAPLAVVE